MGLYGTSQPGMGSGLAEGAAEMLRLRPYWENEYTNGNTQLQFEDWIRDPQILQKYQNAPKVLPRESQPVNYSGQPMMAPYPQDDPNDPAYQQRMLQKYTVR